MDVLKHDEFAAVRPLVPSAHDAGHTALVHAVIEGAMPGNVLVDARERPTSAIVLNDCGFHAALGAPPNDPMKPLLAMIAAEFVSAEPGLLMDVTGAWAPALRTVLPGAYFRNEYHPPATLPAPRPTSGGFTLVPITVAIAQQFDGAVDPWVVRIWGGAAAFVANAFGYAMLSSGGRLASFCTSCGIGGGEAEIEIGTSPQFRQRGLARAVAAVFMAEAYHRGLVPAWTCRSDNEASWRLAESLGYTMFRRVECFPFNRRANRPA